MIISKLNLSFLQFYRMFTCQMMVPLNHEEFDETSLELEFGAKAIWFRLYLMIK